MQETMEEGEQGRFITEEIIYMTKGCCPDCPLMYAGRKESPSRIPVGTWQKLEQDLLAGGHIFECTSATTARIQGRRLPEYVCCYGYFYQHWHEVDALRYAVERQHIRYLDISGWQTLRESGYILTNPKDPLVSYAPGQFRYCSTEEWEALK